MVLTEEHLQRVAAQAEHEAFEADKGRVQGNWAGARPAPLAAQCGDGADNMVEWPTSSDGDSSDGGSSDDGGVGDDPLVRRRAEPTAERQRAAEATPVPTTEEIATWQQVVVDTWHAWRAVGPRRPPPEWYEWVFLTAGSRAFAGRNVEWFLLQQPPEWRQLLEAIAAAAEAPLQRSLPRGATQGRGNRAGFDGLRFGSPVRDCVNDFYRYWLCSASDSGDAVRDIDFRRLSARQATTVRATLGWLNPVCVSLEATLMDEFNKRQENWQGFDADSAWATHMATYQFFGAAPEAAASEQPASAATVTPGAHAAGGAGAVVGAVGGRGHGGKGKRPVGSTMREDDTVASGDEAGDGGQPTSKRHATASRTMDTEPTTTGGTAASATAGTGTDMDTSDSPMAVAPPANGSGAVGAARGPRRRRRRRPAAPQAPGCARRPAALPPTAAPDADQQWPAAPKTPRGAREGQPGQATAGAAVGEAEAAAGQGTQVLAVMGPTVQGGTTAEATTAKAAAEAAATARGGIGRSIRGSRSACIWSA